MILIDKSPEPDCLKVLKTNPDNTYDDLEGDCKKEVQDSLFSDQYKLCAYCQSNFKSTVFIEHYIPQTTDSKKALQYANFLGVCSGKYYLDRKKGTKIDFCSHSRGSAELTINPEDSAHIATLTYDEENRIVSSDAVFNNELNHVLNLNFDDLCLDREISLETETQSVDELAIEMQIGKVEMYQKLIRSILTKPPKFSGFVLFRLNQYLQKTLNK